MYFGSGSAKLQHAQKTLRGQWDATEDGWRDQVRLDFQHRTLEPLDGQATQTIRAMDKLAEVFARIYRDCS